MKSRRLLTRHNIVCGGGIMNVFDTATVQRIWARVQATQEDQIAILLAEELQSWKLYSLLAQKNSRYAPMFRRLAAEERQHAKRLSAVYASIYHRRADVAVQKPKLQESFQERIMRLYHAEQSATQQYQQIACAFPEQRALFLSLAAQEARHATQLETLLKRQKLQTPR